MVTGFIKLNGMTVGAVANRSKVYNEEAEVEAEFDGSLSADGAEKAAEFVQFCDAFNIPVLTLTNVSGFTMRNVLQNQQQNLLMHLQMQQYRR